MKNVKWYCVKNKRKRKDEKITWIIINILLSIEIFIVILDYKIIMPMFHTVIKYYILFGRSSSSSFTLIHNLFCENL